jgi:uncharacterized lipoprotein
MKTTFRHLAWTISLALLVAACSSDARKREYYDAVEAESLEIPEGLAYPASSSAMIITAPPTPLSSFAMDSRPPRVSSTTSGLDSNSRFTWSAQGLYLLVDDSFDSVQRRLGLVIERAGMQRIRIDEKGVYRFDYYQRFEDEDGFFSKLAFWSRDKSEDYSGAYQTFARGDGEKTRVYLKYADGTDCEPDAAEHVLEVIQSRLG